MERQNRRSAPPRRAAGVEMPILGEAKDWSKQSSPAASQAAKRANPASENVTEKDDVPF